MQSSRVISVSDSPFTVPFHFINKQNPSLSFVLLVDKLELDVLTLSDIENKLVGKFPDGVLEVTDSYYSSEIDPTKYMRTIQLLSPLYWELKQKMKVEVDPKLKISGFSLSIGPRMNQIDLYNQVHKQTKLDKNSFYLTITKDGKSTKVSRNSEVAFEPQFLTGSKLLVTKLSTENSKMTIQVDIGKEKIDFKVAPEHTIRELLELINIKTQIPSSSTKLIYNLDVINDHNQTLKDLSVKEGDSFEVLKGAEIGGRLDESAIPENCGIKFADVSNPQGPEKHKWSSSAPKWRIARPGLSLEGKCTNSKCEANGKMVIVNKGFIAYELRGDAYTNTCPICKENVEVELCAFNNCLYQYTGKKYVEKGKPSVLVKNQQKIEAGDEYCRYSVEKVGTADWDTLMIAAFPVPQKDKDKNVCPVCKKIISEKPGLLKCKHEYHPECILVSKDLETSETTECVLCSKNSTLTSIP